MLTLGGAVDTIEAVLPRLCSMSSFCFCFTLSIERICSRACGSSRTVKPIMTGDMLLMLSDAGDATLVLMEFDPPLIVTRRRFWGGSRASGGEGMLAESRASFDRISARVAVDAWVGAS